MYPQRGFIFTDLIICFFVRRYVQSKNGVDRRGELLFYHKSSNSFRKEINTNKTKDIDMLEDRSKADPGDSEDRNNVSELYLWRVEIANGFKKVLNAVIKKSTMSSIISI